MAKCKCGSNKFHAHQVIRNSVTVDGNNIFLESDNDCYYAEKPFGPFTCVDCDAEYEELPT